MRQDDQAARVFVKRESGEDVAEPFSGLVIESDGLVIGAAIFNNWTGRDCEFNGIGRGAFTLPVLRDLFRYVFQNLGCARVTARTRVSNLRARRGLEAIGFRIEGVIRELHEDEDALMYGMLRRECRVVRGL